MKRFMYDFLQKNAAMLCVLLCCSASLFAQNNALTLNGTSQYAYYNGSLSTYEDVTMEGWFKWDGSTGNNQLLMYDGHTSLNGFGLMLDASASNNLIILAGGYQVTSVGRGLDVGEWSHVALVKKGNFFSLYINGDPEIAKAMTYSYPSGSYMVGGNSINNSEFFKGAIDEVHLWNRALSYNEIFTAAATPMTGAETNLVASYRLDNSADGLTGDQTTNGYNLTLVGTPTFTASSSDSVMIRQQTKSLYTGGTSVSVGWHADPHSFVTGYIIYADTSDAVRTQVGTTSSRTDTTFTVTGLLPNTVYYLTARAVTATDTSDYYRLAVVSTFESSGRAAMFSDNNYYAAPFNENIPIGSSAYTIEAWIKPNSMGVHGIVGWGQYGNSYQTNALRLTEDGIINYWWNNDMTISTGNIAGSWHHVAATYDGTTRKMYFDGKLMASENVVYGPEIPFSHNFTIGVTNTSEYFNGEIDEVRIWNVARSESEIVSLLFSPATGSESGLASVYHFDEIVGDYAGDYKNANHAEAVSGTPQRTLSDAMLPFMPARLQAIAGDGQVELRWEKSIHPDFASYTLMAATDIEFTDIVATHSSSAGNASDTSHTVAGLTNGTLYYFAVKMTTNSGATTPFRMNAAVPNTGGPGNALIFDGEDDQIILEDNLVRSRSEMTIETWFKTTTSGGIFGYNDASNAEHVPVIYVGMDGYLQSQLWIGDYNSVMRSLRPVSDGYWHHVALTAGNDNQYLYIDGQLCDSIIGRPLNHLSMIKNQIGRATTSGWPNGGNEYFSGELDEFRFWNRALSHQEVYSYANKSLRGDENGLVLLHHFNEPSGLIYTYDAGPNGWTGGLESFSASTTVASGALRPFSPYNLQSTNTLTSITLKWNRSNAASVRAYYIYTFDGESTMLWDSTTGGLTDTTITFAELPSFTNFTYYLSTVDASGSESEKSNPIFVTTTSFKEVTGTTFSQVVDGKFQWADYDNDGDYDVLVAGSENNGYYPPYQNGTIKLYRHDNGGTFTLVDVGLTQEIHRGTAAWCDYNNDGLPDISYMGSGGNGTRPFKLYKNNGDGTFTEILTNIQGAIFGAMAWGDYDNDGDQDVFVMGSIGSEGGNTQSMLFRNDRNDLFTQVDIGISGYSGGSAAWGDYDRDNDLDLLILGSTNGSYTGGDLHVYRNDGNDVFTEPGEGGYRSGLHRGTAIWADYNNDGYLDIVYSGAIGGGSRDAGVLKNLSGTGFNGFESNPFIGLSKASVSAGDFDNDGDLDFFFTGNHAGGEGSSDIRSILMRNDGDDNFTALQTGIAPITGSSYAQAASAMVDYDRDGDLDIMIEGIYDDGIGNTSYVTKLYNNDWATANTPPSDPNGLSAVTAMDTVTMNWNKSTDAETPQDGLTYNIRVGKTSAGVDVMSPMAKVVGSGNAGGFRYVQESGNTSHNNSWRLSGLSDGTYYWSVEAIDQVYRNSKFQSAAQFTIDGAPSAPDSLSVTSGVNSVTLMWGAKNKSDVSKYFIYVSADNEGYTLIDSTTTGIFGTTKTVTKDPSGGILQNGSLYYFRVEAMDHNGYVSPYSNYVTAIPSATPGKWFVVNTDDSGPGSLRSAIDSTNLSTQKDTVVFLIPIGSSIILNSELPAISTDYTVIDADSNDDGKPDVSLSPIGEGGGYFYGLTIQSSNNLIRGLVIGGFGDYYSGGGSLFIGGDNNKILGNYIGVSSDGMSTYGNAYGIMIDGGSSGTWIGDGTGTGRNIIGGNQQYGIYLNGASTSVNNTKILGNYIGIAADGLTALPNSGPGISIYNRALNTIIGDGTAEGRNIISGNSGEGILLTDNNGHIEGTSILGNYIGTDVTGNVGVGNNNHGIFFNTLTGEGASIVNNTIGDGTAGGRNVISGNAGSGINFYYDHVHDNTIKGNYIGITADGSAALANALYGVNIERSNNNIISSNTISGNAYDGIMINGSYGEANNNVVTGNYIGTNPTGSFAIANGQRGIYLQNGASYNQIGGTAAGEGNIISGNLNGGIGFGYAYTPTVSNQILGNKIGTDASGMFGIPNNESGIYINGSNHNYNYIGDGTTGGRNIISGNDGDGIYINGGASDNFILGNYIGVDATGNTGLANDSNGIAIYNSGHILIGDETAGGRNIISGNGKEGIAIYAQSTEVVIGDGKALRTDAGGGGDKPELAGANNIDIRGNYIGVGTNGSTSLGNGGAGIEIEAVFEGFYSQYDSITSNLIAYNTNGIELVGTGVSSAYLHNNTIYGNTAEGIAIEEGAQNGVTAPAITSISNFVISGSASVGAMVYVYQDAGNQGRYYLGSSAADGEGSWSYNGLFLPGYNVTATQFLDEQSSAFSAPFATPSGTVHATTTSLSYGNVLAGDSATLTTRIYAIGNPVVMNSGSLVLGTNAQMLATLGTDTLFMTDTITVQVRFKPVNFGFLTDTLRIYYGEGNVFDIRIGGTGTSGTIAASSIGFAMETLNGDSTSVPIQIYTTSGWVQLNSATFGQNNYFTYSIDKTLPYIMKPGDTAGVTVTFKPTTFTNSADTLYFANNSSDGMLELMFSGLPLPGTVATNLASQDFGNVLLGDSLELTTKIYAPSGRVEITSVTLSQGDVLSMTVTPALPFTLNAGDTILVKTKFIPSDFNSFNDTITVLSNASNGTVTVSLSGQSLPGTISSAASAFDFGNVLVGDSAQTSTRYYATGGPVQITGSSLVTSGETSVSFTPSLPYLLHVGDSVVVTAKYKPLTFAAMSADTIHLISNASNSGKLSIPMSGFGQTGTLTFNTTPANFGSIRVADSSTAQIVKVYSSVGQIPLTGYTIGAHFKATTSTVFPITIKSGDTVTLAVKFKPQTTGALLDTIKIGNVRIPLAGTGLENVAPTLTLGVTSVIALKQYLGIYMYSSEALSARSAAFKFNDVSVTAPTFDVVSGVNNLYYAQYKLSAAGSLKIDATGTDIAGNIGTRSKTYTIGSLTKDQTLAVEAEGLRISGAKGAIGESGFMIITKSQTYDGDPVGLAKGTSKSETDFANANIQSWDIISTVALEKSVTLTAVYDETWIHALQTQYANFDERKIGFYREENGSLVYLGGEGRNGNVALQTKSLGKFVIQYNDEHRYLPSEITLAQNYPNPFNPTTTIEFGLPEASHVKLVVYNILGQRVAELFNGQRNEGYHKFVWNGRNAQGATVASGVYLYRLETNKGNVTKKMMFIK